MDESILEDLGLSKAEIKIYTALLETGASTSGPIITKSGLQSSVVHRVLKQLVGKGLITYIKIGKDYHYQATDPKNLIDFIDNKKKRFLEILPELENKQKGDKEKYETEMFIGKKAVFSALLSLIKEGKSGEDYFSFSLIEPHDDDEIIEFYQTYNLRRRDKKLAVKVLVNKKVKSIYEKNYTKELLKKAHVRYTDFHFPQGIIIFRNIVLFLNWSDNPSAIKITNTLMAKQFKEFFLEFYNKERDAY